MHKVLRYTLLGFYINSNLDTSKHCSVNEIRAYIHDGSLFDWIEKNLKDVDLSLYTDSDKEEILELFSGLADTVDEERKFGVSNNGLNLLIAYCFEALQQMRDIEKSYRSS